jgi:hypothetical protein
VESEEYLRSRRKLQVVERKGSPRATAAQVIRFVGWRGRKGPRSFDPVTITVAWHELATTVAKEWNGSQMKIWVPFVFYAHQVSVLIHNNSPLLLINAVTSLPKSPIPPTNHPIAVRRDACMIHITSLRTFLNILLIHCYIDF